jgi:hypothetical protein
MGSAYRRVPVLCRRCAAAFKASSPALRCATPALRKLLLFLLFSALK